MVAAAAATGTSVLALQRRQTNRTRRQGSRNRARWAAALRYLTGCAAIESTALRRRKLS
jgi:hypothetical protein